MREVTELRINGASVRVSADAERSLLSVLRDDLDLTGAKYGCGEGQCGACTVLVDGSPTRSCLARVGAVAGKDVTTVEGIERHGKLHPVQEAFLELGALQCGYCTCGMIVAGVALLRDNHSPTAEHVIKALDGHICRCGVYTRIVAAVLKAAGSAQEAVR
jgi:aerobic-type carbon monoxide dehydrogenase small subunit (CoxS/CutS family)